MGESMDKARHSTDRNTPDPEYFVEKIKQTYSRWFQETTALDIKRDPLIRTKSHMQIATWILNRKRCYTKKSYGLC